METLTQYLLSASLLMWVVMLYYRIFLAGQRRFRLNRAFLLGGSLLAVLLPLLRVAAPAGDWAAAGLVRTLPEVLLGTANASPADEPVGMGGMDLLPLAYLVVVAILGLIFLYRLSGLLLRIATSPREKRDGYTLVFGGMENGPASFFGYLFWDSAMDEGEEGALVILAHERCHIRQRHSIDLLWLESLSVLFWFNPAIYLLRRDLRRCHEFLADEAAALEGGKEALFRQVLARQFRIPQITLANHFQSQIKARITMLNKKSGHKALFRYLLILPLVGLMFACTSLDRDPAAEKDVITSQEVVKKPLAESDSEIGKEMVQPKPINLLEIYESIGYPEDAKSQKLEGKVMVQVLVGKDGLVQEHKVLKASSPIFSEAIEKHLYELKFEPGTSEGKPVKVWVTIPFSFKMD